MNLVHLIVLDLLVILVIIEAVLYVAMLGGLPMKGPYGPAVNRLAIPFGLLILMVNWWITKNIVLQMPALSFNYLRRADHISISMPYNVPAWIWLIVLAVVQAFLIREFADRMLLAKKQHDALLPLLEDRILGLMTTTRPVKMAFFERMIPRWERRRMNVREIVDGLLEQKRLVCISDNRVAQQHRMYLLAVDGEVPQTWEHRIEE